MARILPDSFVDSAGTGSYHIGSPPDLDRLKLPSKMESIFDTKVHDNLNPKDFGDFDHIYVMDRQNYRDVVAQANNSAEVDKVELICEAADMGSMPVPDPYYGGDDGFQKVFDLINDACDRIVKKWK